MQTPLYTQSVAGFGSSSVDSSAAFPGNAGPIVHRPTVMYEQDAQPFGANAADSSMKLATEIGYALGTAGSMAGIYHGYKRNNGSIGWALAWGLFGGIWPIAVPLMFAQGFAKPIGSMKRNPTCVKCGGRVGAQSPYATCTSCRVMKKKRRKARSAR